MLSRQKALGFSISFFVSRIVTHFEAKPQLDLRIDHCYLNRDPLKLIVSSVIEVSQKSSQFSKSAVDYSAVHLSSASRICRV